MKAIISAIKSPEGWFFAVFIAAVLVGPAGLRERLRQIPDNFERAQSSTLIEAQQKAEKAARLNQILIRQCVEERGLGAAPVFGEDGNFLRCVARKGLK